jgi:tetratricopeptide (TPR) repeat protein
VKASVLLPEAGQKFTDPSISALKLSKLRELYPDDPQVAFLLAMQAFQNGSPEETLARCDALLSKHKTFPGGYLLKSYVQQSKADFKGSIASLETLLKIDPNDGQAHSNLGYSYLLTGRTKDALKHLETGLTLYPAMVNAISLAEAYRMTGELEKARALVTSAERNLELPGVEEEYFVSGQWLWNHLPEKDGDTESFKQTITCGSLAQKRAVLRITQGLLAATDGDEKAALDHFREVLKLEPHYRPFLINKLRATVHAGAAPEAIKARMTAYANALEESADSR